MNMGVNQGAALIVVAHPDDEVLGCGATGAAFASAGYTVQACILAAQANARHKRPSDAMLLSDTLKAQAVLGFGEPLLGAFPNIALNTVPHLALVQFIEEAIKVTGATIVFTHHGRDLNNDHLHVSLACQAAVKLSRRRGGIPVLRELLFMETLSSTDWSVPDGRNPFDPDCFFSFDESMMQKKIKALSCYRDVMRPAPHSRSEDVLRALAVLRGAQAGSVFAEAYSTGYRMLNPR